MNGVSEARHRLRLLHISDIHEKAAREKEPARRYRVLESKAWERNVEALLEHGRIDLICFTGDAADWGKAEEYERVTSLFQVLLDWLDLPPERLFVIPGNHDIDRSKHPDAWDGLKTQLDRGVDPLSLARWACKGPLPPAFDETWHDQILARQAPYRSWVKDTLGRPELLPEASPHGSLGYRCTIKLPHLPGPVHLIGLDTAGSAAKR